MLFRGGLSRNEHQYSPVQETHRTEAIVGPRTSRSGHSLRNIVLDSKLRSIVLDSKLRSIVLDSKLIVSIISMKDGNVKIV